MSKDIGSPQIPQRLREDQQEIRETLKTAGPQLGLLPSNDDDKGTSHLLGQLPCYH